MADRVVCEVQSTKYVALLRGINAGGNRKVEMARLRQLFEGLGFKNVKTYINSGNVIFDAEMEPSSEQIQQTIEETFGFDVPTLVLPGDDVVRIAKAIPADWTNDYDMIKSDVLYLFEQIDAPDILEKIGVKPEIEQFIYVKGAAICTISRKNAPKGSLQKLISTDLYKNMTVRNVTTARKLAELVVNEGD